MSSVVCGGKLRQIEIQSVELTPYLSFCEKPTLNNSCTELIHQKVETSCNGKKKCKQLIWNQSVSTWDDCIRIPQVFKISFSCIKGQCISNYHTYCMSINSRKSRLVNFHRGQYRYEPWKSISSPELVYQAIVLIVKSLLVFVLMFNKIHTRTFRR